MFVMKCKKNIIFGKSDKIMKKGKLFIKIIICWKLLAKFSKGKIAWNLNFDFAFTHKQLVVTRIYQMLYQRDKCCRCWTSLNCAPPGHLTPRIIINSYPEVAFPAYMPTLSHVRERNSIPPRNPITGNTCIGTEGRSELKTTHKYKIRPKSLQNYPLLKTAMKIQVKKDSFEPRWSLTFQVSTVCWNICNIDSSLFRRYISYFFLFSLFNDISTFAGYFSHPCKEHQKYYGNHSWWR